MPMETKKSNRLDVKIDSFCRRTDQLLKDIHKRRGPTGYAGKDFNYEEYGQTLIKKHTEVIK